MLSRQLGLLDRDLAGVTGDKNFMTCSWKGVCENITVEMEQVAFLMQPGYEVHVSESCSWPLVSRG